MTIAARLLEVIDRDILPLTESAVAKGNKVFGAAILRKVDYSGDRGHQRETVSRLWHGGWTRSIASPTVRSARWSKPDLSGSTRTLPDVHVGDHLVSFDNFYLFSHEESRDAFRHPASI